MGKIAFVFSGQGAQYSGMGKELYECSKSAKNVFQIAQSIRENTVNQCFSGTKEDLSETVNTQPALFCVDLAAAEAVKEAGILPDMIAGFSLGEIPALAFSGALKYEEAFKLVCKRAELMNKCAKESKGEMVAVLGLDSDRIEELCSKCENTYPVNYNCDSQTVVAGSAEGVEKLAVLVKEAGGKAKKLDVSGAFHSPYMNGAAEGMADYLSEVEFNLPQIPVYANSTAELYNDKMLISKQINNPVRWKQTVKKMIGEGADTFIEVGAGKVLTGLIKKIVKEMADDTMSDIRVFNVEDEAGLKEVILNVKE